MQPYIINHWSLGGVATACLHICPHFHRIGRKLQFPDPASSRSGRLQVNELIMLNLYRVEVKYSYSKLFGYSSIG
jgi:hypothetical protein